MAERNEALQLRANALFRQTHQYRRARTRNLAAARAAAAPPFSSFVPWSLDRALEMTDKLMAITKSAPTQEEGIAQAFEFAEGALKTEDPDLVRHALGVFLTHSTQTVAVPSVRDIAPEQFVPSAGPGGPPGGPPPSAADDHLLAAQAVPESALNWFREDPFANEHHWHWHQVYPHRGVPDGAGQRHLKDRQGELFVYMHEQMLARYETERLALGMKDLAPLADYQAPIPDGYDSGIPGFMPRPDNAVLTFWNRGGGVHYTVADHERVRDGILTAVTDGTLKTAAGATMPITIDLLGATEESSIGSADENRYGGHHNIGHVLIASCPDPLSGVFGVMSKTSTAIRDSVFWRWHKHIDDIAFSWQEKQPAEDFSDGPPVVVRKSLSAAAAASSPDVIVCALSSIPGAGQPGFDGDAFGEQTFGGQNWNLDPDSTPNSARVLNTSMKTLTTTVDGQQIDTPYLDHESFAYFVRLENTSAAERRVTIRIFLVATARADNRRSWIEMDKFSVALAAHARKVVFRRDDESSVVWKPARRPGDPPPAPHPGEDQNYCDCGWPYHLLLPRGTAAGMEFRFIAMVTDWEKDHVQSTSPCGSMSFCGAKDEYPDTRTMGYPFHRPFPQGGISQFIASRTNVATRDLRIKLV